MVLVSFRVFDVAVVRFLFVLFFFLHYYYYFIQRNVAMIVFMPPNITVLHVGRPHQQQWWRRRRRRQRHGNVMPKLFVHSRVQFHTKNRFVLLCHFAYYNFTIWLRIANCASPGRIEMQKFVLPRSHAKWQNFLFFFFVLVCWHRFTPPR